MIGQNQVSRPCVRFGCKWEQWHLPSQFKCWKTPTDLLNNA
ncbi:hypothetical protein RBSWK_00569 [Rhodopirellula baltica SWK14]|uniref:Uncharacterized protein n=1 Tax=Rhodopirellula baltica SWK14 TaxID=993516 RepID=L7CQT7_RHOBT|nr:hypothetical protein RBSWK_00569 [Rhodopirellula baltica SWK14]